MIAFHFTCIIYMYNYLYMYNYILYDNAEDIILFYMMQIFLF